MLYQPAYTYEIAKCYWMGLARIIRYLNNISTLFRGKNKLRNTIMKIAFDVRLENIRMSLLMPCQ